MAHNIYDSDIEIIKSCLKKREEDDAEKTEKLRKEKAALKIQTAGRSKLAKKQFEDLKKEKLNREGQVRTEGSKVIKITEKFNKFIEEVKALDFVNTTDLEGVTQETKDFVEKTDGYMENGTLEKGEFLLTIFEVNDITSNFINVLEEGNPTLQIAVDDMYNNIDNDDKQTLQLINDTTEFFTDKEEWDKLQKQDEKNIVNGKTIKQLKIGIIKNFLSNSGDNNNEDLAKKLNVDEFTENLKTNFDDYKKFIDLILNISKSFIIIYILQQITNPEDYKKGYEKLSELADSVNLDDSSKSILEKIKKSIENKKSEEEKEKEEEPEPEEEEEEEDLSEVLKKIFELHGINNDTINGINNDIINLYNYEESSYGKRRRRKFGSNSSETREGMTEEERREAYELSQKYEVVSEEEIKGKISNEVKKKEEKVKKVNDEISKLKLNGVIEDIKQRVLSNTGVKVLETNPLLKRLKELFEIYKIIKEALDKKPQKDTSNEDPWWDDDEFEKTINKDLLLDYQITTIAFNICEKTDRDYKHLLFLNYIDIAGEQIKKKIENNKDIYTKILENFKKYKTDFNKQSKTESYFFNDNTFDVLFEKDKLYIQNCMFDENNSGKRYYCPDNFRNFSNIYKNIFTYYEKYKELDEYSNFIRVELENLIKNPSKYKTNILEEVQKKLEGTNETASAKKLKKIQKTINKESNVKHWTILDIVQDVKDFHNRMGKPKIEEFYSGKQIKEDLKDLYKEIYEIIEKKIKDEEELIKLKIKNYLQDKVYPETSKTYLGKEASKIDSIVEKLTELKNTDFSEIFLNIVKDEYKITKLFEEIRERLNNKPLKSIKTKSDVLYKYFKFFYQKLQEGQELKQLIKKHKKIHKNKNENNDETRLIEDFLKHKDHRADLGYILEKLVKMQSNYNKIQKSLNDENLKFLYYDEQNFINSINTQILQELTYDHLTDKYYQNIKTIKKKSEEIVKEYIKYKNLCTKIDDNYIITDFEEAIKKHEKRFVDILGSKRNQMDKINTLLKEIKEKRELLEDLKSYATKDKKAEEERRKRREEEERKEQKKAEEKEKAERRKKKNIINKIYRKIKNVPFDIVFRNVSMSSKFLIDDHAEYGPSIRDEIVDNESIAKVKFIETNDENIKDTEKYNKLKSYLEIITKDEAFKEKYIDLMVKLGQNIQRNNELSRMKKQIKSENNEKKQNLSDFDKTNLSENREKKEREMIRQAEELQQKLIEETNEDEGLKIARRNLQIKKDKLQRERYKGKQKNDFGSTSDKLENIRLTLNDYDSIYEQFKQKYAEQEAGKSTEKTIDSIKKTKEKHIINLLKQITNDVFIYNLEEEGQAKKNSIYGWTILTKDLENLEKKLVTQIEKEEEEKEVRGKKEQEESRKRILERREEEERRLREAKELERERKKAREERKKRINDAKNFKKKEIMKKFEYLLKGYKMEENFSEYLTSTMSRKSKLKRKYVDYFKFKEKELKEAHMGIINIKNLKNNNRKLKEIKELLKRESKKHTFLGLGFGEVEQIDYKEIKLEEIETVVRRFIQKNATFVIRSLGRDYKSDLSVKAYLEFIKEQ